MSRAAPRRTWLAVALAVVSMAAACSDPGADPAVEAAEDARDRGGESSPTTGGSAATAGQGEPADPQPPESNSADRVIFWLGCNDLANLTDEDLDLWDERGVDGFACQTGALATLGGAHSFDPAPGASLEGDEYGLHRGLRASRIGARAAARGMKLYLSFYVANSVESPTPFVDWFDDGRWSTDVLPAIQDLAGAARAMGFAGVGIDTELYPTGGDVVATWSWDYQTNTRPEEEVRAQVRARGAEVMDALLAGFPDVDVLLYAVHVPGSWEELVELQVNNLEAAFEEETHLDFLDGLSSVPEFAAIRLLNAVFYKTTHVAGVSWDAAMRHDVANFYALLSRELPHWADIADRVHSSPFVWISSGGSDFERARPPEEVAEQLAASARWGTGGEFGNYVFGDLADFDYGPYVDGLRSASTPQLVTVEPPEVEVTEQSVDGERAVVAGFADDAYAIRVVRWDAGRGETGVAELTWDPIEPDRLGRVRWQIEDVPVDAGSVEIRITVTNVKDLSTTVTVTLGNG